MLLAASVSGDGTLSLSLLLLLLLLTLLLPGAPSPIVRAVPIKDQLLRSSLSLSLGPRSPSQLTCLPKPSTTTSSSSISTAASDDGRQMCILLLPRPPARVEFRVRSWAPPGHCANEPCQPTAPRLQQKV